MKKPLEALVREAVLMLGEEEAENLLRPVLEAMLELGGHRRQLTKRKALEQIAKAKPDGGLTEAQKAKLKRKFTNGT